MVNGTLIETPEDTKSNPTAMSKGFRSGFASATILLKDDFPCGSFLSACDTLDQTEGFGVEPGSGPEVAPDSGVFDAVSGVGEVEYSLGLFSRPSIVAEGVRGYCRSFMGPSPTLKVKERVPAEVRNPRLAAAAVGLTHDLATHSASIPVY